MGQAYADRHFAYRLMRRSEGFAWHPSYACGLDDIDAMHRAMVDRLDRLDRIVRHNETGAAAALRDLEVATRRHFEHEEHLLEGMGSFAAQTHRREHNHLLRLLRDGAKLCADRVRGETQATALQAYLRIMGRWLLHEITANDHHLVAITRVRRSVPRTDL